MGHEGHDHDHDPGHDAHHGHKVHSQGSHSHAHGDAGHAHSHAAHEHKSHAPAHVAAFVATCSDSRDAAQDESGAHIRQALEEAGHTVSGYRVVKDDLSAVRELVDAALQSGARALIVNGGTGIGRRDNTIEALTGLFEKELPGFGEIFRALSFKEIGSAAMLSRATAGIAKGLVIFALPGSPQAARLAMRELILPELGHLVRELTR